MLFTDLDRTIIFSKRFERTDDAVLVESKGEQSISYVTGRSYELLKQLFKEGLVIPVTARTLEQTNRISFIQEYAPEWLVCESGAVILHNGKRVTEWDQFIIENDHYREEMNKVVFPLFKEVMKLFDCSISRRNDYTMVAKMDANENTERLVSAFPKLTNFFEKRHGNLYLQDNKVILLSKHIDKGHAVRFIQREAGISHSIGAGDSSMDVGMLQQTTISIAPGHHTMNDFVPKRVTKETGLKAGEEIVQFAVEQLLK